MSEVIQQHQQDVAGVQSRIAARLEAEAKGEDPSQLPPGELSDTDEGAPDPKVESVDSDDGALSQDEDEGEYEEDIEDEESDEDDAPDDDEDPDSETWEKRYKDQQEFLTESRESLKAAEEQVTTMRQETAQRMGEITKAGFELEDRFAQVEEVSNMLLQGAAMKLQKANSINLAQVPQEQYQQAQAFVQQAQQEYQRAQAALQQAAQHRKQARDQRLQREVAVAQMDLSGEFPNFIQETYPALGKFAAQYGVNPEVFSSITDPGLIRIINKAMTLSAEPDTPTELVRKPKAKKHRSRNQPGKVTGTKARIRKADKAMHEAPDARGRQAAFMAKKRAALDGENRR